MTRSGFSISPDTPGGVPDIVGVEERERDGGTAGGGVGSSAPAMLTAGIDWAVGRTPARPISPEAFDDMLDDTIGEPLDGVARTTGPDVGPEVADDVAISGTPISGVILRLTSPDPGIAIAPGGALGRRGASIAITEGGGIVVMIGAYSGFGIGGGRLAGRPRTVSSSGMSSRRVTGAVGRSVPFGPTRPHSAVWPNGLSGALPSSAWIARCPMRIISTPNTAPAAGL